MTKRKNMRERGQALILVAFGAIALFAITGLAIDGSHKYSDRRHAQNAADTAAMAAALSKARGNSNWDLDGLDRALENGYDDDHVSNEVEVYTCDDPHADCGIYDSTNDVRFDPKDYIQVIITSHRPTWFMRVLGIQEFTNIVRATASTRSENNNFTFGGNAIVALRPDGCALRATGTTFVTVNGGGMYSNSADSCSFQKTTCSGVIDVNDDHGNTGTITMVGGAHLNISCWNPAGAALSAGGIKQYSFPPPFQEIAPPNVCSQSLVDIGGNPSTVTLSPGHYANMPPKSNMKDITLLPGIYCIDNEIRIGSTDNFRVSGTFPTTPGVFLYLKSGGSFTFNGGSTVNLWGINDASVTADSNLLPYKNYLIYAAPNYALDPASLPNCTINGGSTSTYQGAIFAPYCNLNLSGNSGMLLNSQVIGYTVDMSGASGVTINYNSSNQPYWTIPLQIGLAK
jgi:hypothetical protein